MIMFIQTLRNHCKAEGLIVDVSLEEELFHMAGVLQIAFENKGEL
jgi:hypothetical protein